MWMNQVEIEAVSQMRQTCPNVRKAVRLLRRLMEAVNDQSDGWPYWQAPSKAAEKLIGLLDKAGLDYTGRIRGTITEAELRKAVTPIRAMVTRQRKKQAQYGNTFEFDVDAALAEAD